MEAAALGERLVPDANGEIAAGDTVGIDVSSEDLRTSDRELTLNFEGTFSRVGTTGKRLDLHSMTSVSGDDGEITRDEFLEHGLRTATSYATTVAGTAAQIADYLEERFEGSGSRGGFMLRHSQAEQIEMLHNIVDLLVPELQRRGRFRTAYTGRTLRENLAT